MRLRTMAGRRPWRHIEREESYYDRTLFDPWYPNAVRQGGRTFAHFDALALPGPVVQAMAADAHSDVVIWRQVIPSTRLSNIGRELVLEGRARPRDPRAVGGHGLFDEHDGGDRGGGVGRAQ